MTTLRLSEALPKRADLGYLKEHLLDRREALLKDVRSMEEEETKTAGSGLSISADLGTDRAAHEVSLGCMESAIDEVQEIDDALRRLQEGTFGLCEACGLGICLKRLRAIPYTKLCLPCKKAEEATA